ncbi:MAG: NYN domain-containing protein [Planctomycetaceae bacterium]|nr:NYN domain-containing protein [Planctomycetaceae bacterium]
MSSSMFRGDLIIDGYNVLHAAELAPPRDRPQGLERSRNALLRLFAEKLTPRERQRTTVVFDAPECRFVPSAPTLVEDMRVLFADREGDADEAIERLIRLNSAPRRLTVISSDHRLQRAARRRRAGFLDSDVFLRRLARRAARDSRRAATGEPQSKRSGGLPPGEVEAWLRVFDDIGEVGVTTNGDAPDRRTAVSDGVSAPPPVNERRPASSVERPADQTDAAQSQSMTDLDEVAFWEARIAEIDPRGPA